MNGSTMSSFSLALANIPRSNRNVSGTSLSWAVMSYCHRDRDMLTHLPPHYDPRMVPWRVFKSVPEPLVRRKSLTMRNLIAV